MLDLGVKEVLYILEKKDRGKCTHARTPAGRTLLFLIHNRVHLVMNRRTDLSYSEEHCPGCTARRCLFVAPHLFFLVFFLVFLLFLVFMVFCLFLDL